jgi:hypothetical protein
MAARQVQRHRGAVTDASFAAMGDILLYQAHGDAIRNFIRDQIVKAPAPRVGRRAQPGRDRLRGLIRPRTPSTSAAGDGRLASAISVRASGPCHRSAHDQPLPPHFPAWLNIYDLRDLLSYIGAKVFPGRVSDVKVNNPSAFP